MKKRYKDILIICFIIYLFIIIILQKELIFNTISYSLNLWVKTLIPTMFPAFIISDILISYNITNYIPNHLKKLFRTLFNTNENTITIFFLSLLSGFPSNARIINIMYEKNQITKEEGEHALIFTHFSNPIFILSTISLKFLHNESFGYLILVSHILGNIILGILTRNYSHNNHVNYTKKKNNCQNFSQILINSIKHTIDSLLLILGTLTCFLIISSLIIYHINISPYTNSIIKGILEITMGLKSLSLLNIPNIYKVVISCMFISFGGLSIHMQIISQITDLNIKYHKFLLARIIHSIISGTICFILYILIYTK